MYFYYVTMYITAKSYLKCCHVTFATVVKVLQQLQNKIEISYPYKPIPEQGLEHFKQEQSMNF